MAVLAFEIDVRTEDEDAAVAALDAIGTMGIEVRPLGAAVVLLAYFEDAPGQEDAVRQAALAACAGARVRPVPVAQVDWVARFRETFRAFQAGGFLIAPAWDPPAARGPRVLLMEPGQAFGTGTHESTRLCLAELLALAPGGLGRVADVGTGTAILAIAACRLGSPFAVAVDDDPAALAVAARHLELNPSPVHLVRGDGGRPLRPRCADTVIANLTAPLLVARAAEIAALAREGGRLVLAGLLAEDVDAVRAAYDPFGRAAVRRENEWAALRLDVAAGPAGAA